MLPSWRQADIDSRIEEPMSGDRNLMAIEPFGTHPVDEGFEFVPHGSQIDP